MSTVTVTEPCPDAVTSTLTSTLAPHALSPVAKAPANAAQANLRHAKRKLALWTDSGDACPEQ
jgi:hypothetical protein